MAGRMGAIAVTVGHNRRAAAARRAAADPEIKILFEKYDKNQTGYLERSEIADLVRDLGGTPPTEEELQWLMYTADGSGGDALDNRISLGEFRHALEAYMNYKEHEKEIESIFRKYDSQHRGQLNHEDLKRVLTDLNDGHTPSDAEVEWVLQMADRADGVQSGGVNRHEFQAAISVWFTKHEHRHEHGHHQESSDKCVVM